MAKAVCQCPKIVKGMQGQEGGAEQVAMRAEQSLIFSSRLASEVKEKGDEERENDDERIWKNCIVVTCDCAPIRCGCSAPFQVWL